MIVLMSVIEQNNASHIDWKIYRIRLEEPQLIWFNQSFAYCKTVQILDRSFSHSAKSSRPFLLHILWSANSEFIIQSFYRSFSEPSMWQLNQLLRRIYNKAIIHRVRDRNLAMEGSATLLNNIILFDQLSFISRRLAARKR